MNIPQIDCRIGLNVTTGVEKTDGGYRLSLSGNFFDRVIGARLTSPGIIRAFETDGDMLRLLAVHMDRQREWFEQALEENSPTGHDYGLVHVCIPMTDSRGEEICGNWVFYHTYQFDLFNLVSVIKKREDAK